MSRPAVIRLVLTSLGAAAICLATGQGVRLALAPNQGFWLIRGAVYLVRDQHVSNPVAALAPYAAASAFARALLGVAIVGCLVLLRRALPDLPSLPDVVAGLFVGGGLANEVEIILAGSVTDFLGIHRSGVYSAGDLMMDAASSLLPLAAIQTARAAGVNSRRTALIGGGTFAAVLVIYLVGQDYLGIVSLLVVCAGLIFAAQLRRPRAFEGVGRGARS